MIIQTSDNRFFEVSETGDADLSHCWYGIEVRRDRKRGWIKKARISHPRPMLVRKAASQVIAA